MRNLFKKKLGRNPQIITATIVLLFTIIVALTSCNGTSKVLQDQDKAVLKSVTLNDLKSLPSAEPPILSAQEAISYAINIEFIHSELQGVEQKADFVTWNVGSQLTTRDDTSGWEVKITSSGMLPSFTCDVSFSSEGKINSNPYCEYNK